MLGVVLLGPPGVGKGTQAERLKAALGLAHVSTGDILRREVAGGTPLGARVKAVIDSGGLVPDELMGEVVQSALAGVGPASAGYLLDGFPRTLPQVAILDEILARETMPLDHALLIDAPESTLVRRLAGRRVCRACGALYHIEGPAPAVAGRCDACGGELWQRDDDRESVVVERLRVYRRQTAPAIAAYRERGILREIDGSGTPDEVHTRVVQVLGGVRA